MSPEKAKAVELTGKAVVTLTVKLEVEKADPDDGKTFTLADAGKAAMDVAYNSIKFCEGMGHNHDLGDDLCVLYPQVLFTSVEEIPDAAQGPKVQDGPQEGPDMSSWTPAEREAHLTKERMRTPVAEMKLAVRIINTLEENGVILAEHFFAQTYDSLMGMKNFGEKTLVEVREAISALGLKPPEWPKPPKAKKVPKARLSKKGGIGSMNTGVW